MHINTNNNFHYEPDPNNILLLHPGEIYVIMCVFLFSFYFCPVHSFHYFGWSGVPSQISGGAVVVVFALCHCDCDS